MLTPTAIELMNCPKFWKKRIEDQVEYAIRYNASGATRPDKKKVYDSAVWIMERCQKNLLKLTPKPCRTKHRALKST